MAARSLVDARRTTPRGATSRPPGSPFGAAYVDMIGTAILHHGTESQRQRFLRGLLIADEVWCQGFSEPGAGSDLGGLRTWAERRGDELVVTGQKVWTSHADHAGRCFLLCRTGSDESKHRGISLALEIAGPYAALSGSPANSRGPLAFGLRAT